MVKDKATIKADGTAPAAKKPAPVLPWMRVPITIEAGSGIPVNEVGGLDSGLKKVLRTALHYPELFPVQSLVWQQLAGGASTAHDMCIAAPTGSGKTLAYALPVINGVARRRGSDGGGVHCLQALVVLPTRDLAAQVFALFATLCPAAGLTVALAAAQSTQAAEVAQLVGPDGCETGGADVVVATPGRLMWHLQATPGFTLEHLRFLVVDEADRLLRQSYQEWLPSVLQQLAGHRRTRLRDAFVGADAGSLMPYAQDRVVKLVVSATLSRDPAKLARLELHCPRYVATSAEDHRYHLPRSLSEFKVMCSAAAQKPLVLLALLRNELAGQSTLVFTSSLDMTHKLFLMLEAANGTAAGGTDGVSGTTVEFSSLLTSAQRARNLERFKSGAATVLVASDAMTRGMDVEGVQNVVNYDAPVYAKTYVHRAGRTARAGRTGRVFTLLRDEDMRHFKAMLRKADNNFVADFKVPPAAVEALRPQLAAVLAQVQALLEAEQQQAQQPLGAAAGAGNSAAAAAKRGKKQPPAAAAPPPVVQAPPPQSAAPAAGGCSDQVEDADMLPSTSSYSQDEAVAAAADAAADDAADSGGAVAGSSQDGGNAAEEAPTAAGGKHLKKKKRRRAEEGADVGGTGSPLRMLKKKAKKATGVAASGEGDGGAAEAAAPAAVAKRRKKAKKAEETA